MRKLAIRGLLAAALCAGLALTVRAAADGDEPAAPSGLSAWWNGLFGSADKPAEKTDKTEKKKTEPVDKPAKMPVLEREAVKRRERNALVRRLAVCDRLREVAHQKNDHDLERRIDELEEKINNLYLQRTAGLGQNDIADETPPKEKAKADAANASNRVRNTGEDEQ
jgi:hypothetical protein